MNHHASGKRLVASAIIPPHEGVPPPTPTPEERQRRLEQDVGRDEQRGVDDQRREQVGEDLAHDDPAVRRAERARRLHELLLAQREDLAAHDARDVGPVDDRDDHDHDRQSGLDQAAEAAVGAGARGGEAEAEQQDREGEHDVGQARRARCRPAPR